MRASRKRDSRENDVQILDRWHKGSACGGVEIDRDRAFQDVGNELIINVEGWHYTKHYLPCGRYVVLAWDDSGNECIE